MEKDYSKTEFSPKKVEEQVGRFQEILYEFIKGLSKLRKDQNYFQENLSSFDTSK